MGQQGRRGPKLIPEGHLVNTKLPKVVYEAMRQAAGANYESPAGWIRRTIIERLRADGLLPPLAERGNLTNDRVV